MFKKGQYVMYKTDVCTVKDIKKNKYNNLECYELEPVFDKTLKVSVPTNNKNGYLRKLLTKKEALDLIKQIPKVDVIETENKNIENDYLNLLHTKSHLDLIKVIKTTYLRNKQRKEAKRSIGQKDDAYFKMAEKCLYEELSVVFNLSYDDTKNYVIKKIKEECCDEK